MKVLAHAWMDYVNDSYSFNLFGDNRFFAFDMRSHVNEFDCLPFDFSRYMSYQQITNNYLVVVGVWRMVWMTFSMYFGTLWPISATTLI